MCCYCAPLTVRLFPGRRSFRCAYCLRLAPHPPVDLDFCRDGYAYCDCCGRWMLIEGYRTFKSAEEFEAAAGAPGGVLI